MQLDVEEAREIARKIISGGAGPASPKAPVGVQKGMNQRRNLGGDKVRDGGGRGGGSSGNGVDKRRSKPGPGKRGVRFSSHPARRGQGKRR